MRDAFVRTSNVACHSNRGVLDLLAMSHEGTERWLKTSSDFQCVTFGRSHCRCSGVTARHSKTKNKKALPCYCSESHTTHNDEQLFHFFLYEVCYETF